MKHSAEFAQRRQALLDWIKPDGVAVLFAAPPRSRNHDVEHPYRQNSNFYYLTGFLETDAVAVFIPGREAGEFVLFCQANDPEHEIWHGKRAGLDGAKSLYGAHESYDVSQLDELMPDLLSDRERVYAVLSEDAEHDAQILHWIAEVRSKVRTGVSAPSQLQLLQEQLGEWRLVKSPVEQDLMRHAAKVTAQAHQQVMVATKPGLKEYQLFAVFQNELLNNHCLSQAYPAIIGAGDNACVLHYTENNSELQAGDLLLIDAGAEYEYYAADVTRTYPVSGRFTPEQRQIYELVLQAQESAINLVKPGTPWEALQTCIVEVLTKGLLELGLLQGELSALIEDKAYKKFYMHNSGHWLGLDVHDAGRYTVDGKSRPLVPGMVLTVEPGIYIQPGTEGIEPKWWGIGVRIEDDILVTESGHENLTASVAKAVSEIEAVMAQAS